jgi:hypothetical protein
MPPPALTGQPWWVQIGECPTAELDDLRATTMPPAIVEPPTGMSDSLTIAPGGGPAWVLVDVVVGGLVGGLVDDVDDDVGGLPVVLVPVLVDVVAEPVPVPDGGRVVAEALEVARPVEADAPAAEPVAVASPAGAEVASTEAPEASPPGAPLAGMVSPTATGWASPFELQAARPTPAAPRATTEVMTVRRLTDWLGTRDSPDMSTTDS